jgi:hypothetical protein
MSDVRYDYTNQAWIEDGRYSNCGHPATMACGCYGRAHQGELAPEPEPWEEIRHRDQGDGRIVRLLRQGRDYLMTGGPAGDHCLTDSSEERALAHWSGYAQYTGRRGGIA